MLCKMGDFCKNGQVKAGDKNCGTIIVGGHCGVLQTGCERTEESETEVVLDVPTVNKQEFESDIVAEKSEVEIVPTSLAVSRQESDTNTVAAVGSLEIIEIMN